MPQKKKKHDKQNHLHIIELQKYIDVRQLTPHMAALIPRHRMNK